MTKLLTNTGLARARNRTRYLWILSPSAQPLGCSGIRKELLYRELLCSKNVERQYIPAWVLSSPKILKRPNGASTNGASTEFKKNVFIFLAGLVVKLSQLSDYVWTGGVADTVHA